MSDIFVSYASPDRDIALKIVDFLESHDVRCWVAPRDVPAGMEYGQAIIQGIEQSRAMVLILSEESNNSPFVHKEVERAVSKVKPVIPVRIREVLPSGSLEFFVSSAQWVDAWKPPMEQHLLRLAQALKNLPEGGGGSVTLPAAAPASGRRVLPTAAAIGLAAAVAIGVFAWKPWLTNSAPARGDLGFLVGHWCETVDGVTWQIDMARDGADRIAGQTRHPQSDKVLEWQAKVVPITDGFEFTAAGAEATPGGPARFRIVDDRTLTLVYADGAPQSGPTRVRCSR